MRNSVVDFGFLFWQRAARASRGAPDAHDLAVVEIVAVHVVSIIIHRHGGRGPQGEAPAGGARGGGEASEGGSSQSEEGRRERILRTHVLYSMSRISTSSAKPAADMNHAAVASADIASWNEAAQLATAGTSAPTNIALVISLSL